ncbi:exodeoxyribonuclease VII large subunit [Longimicrobium terrae]|uniref:Exodeoxyribonuclease 7 large subunit n=2 Tax=Longimicrobium terrae TaxID=1639882 RepID=A0A841GLT4_9BACT|nr:exodeoxyribonuclease VII large subunit [Longimicrobium terrae]MBB6069557.1 exodeoxyribonuclease VII large subunit [Longimicrobium terrae]
MTWDLFSSADPPPKEPEKPKGRGAARTRGTAKAPEFSRGPDINEASNEDIARRVAAQQADAGFLDEDTGPVMPRRAGPEGGWTPSTVNAAARALIEGTFPPLWVNGEVSNFTKARSGHCYFSLRDEDSQIRCVMWRDEARRLPTMPTEGMAVRTLGRLTLYEGRGEFQMVVSDLEGRGEGLWKLAFDQLRTKLEMEGLTSPLRKRPLPEYPACVGVVTSSTGAAVRDIISVIRRRAPWTEIMLSAARVQGEGAADEVARAIRLIARAGCADVLIVGRGGGSTEDLWAFNEEAVARAIAESPIPVISAVGHETDFTIADLVADLRAPTPSAAAEAAVPDGAQLRRGVAELGGRLARCTRERLQDAHESLLTARLDLRDVAESVLAGRREQVAGIAGKLHALSPLATLARGFAVPIAPGGRVLRTTAEFAPGQEFRLRVADGSVSARVEGVDPE